MNNNNLSILAMPFLVSGPVWVLIFATTLMVTLGRLLGSNVMMWATPVFAAFALYEVFGRWKRTGLATVVAVLLCSSMIGVFGVYHSPYILQTNWQITRQEVRGVTWFQTRAHLRFGGGFASLGVTSTIPGRFPVPEHFGYREHRTLGESFPMDTYVVLTEAFRVSSTRAGLPRAMMSSWARLRASERDFQKLDRDPSVCKLYSNGEFDVLRVIAAG